jgi:mannan endo-1,4-beta-mannosidase
MSAQSPLLASRRDILRGAAITAGGLLAQACASGGGAPAPATPAGAAGGAPGAGGLPGGLEVRGTRFMKDGKPFFVSGFNYWPATTLAREGNTAGWDQVRRDLDALQGLGINMIRTMGATEGPDSEPYRIVPTLQPSPGQYDPAGVAGLVRLGDELKRRGLYAILMLNNFWQWSGGMAQYLSWAGEGPIPYPPPTPGGSWDRFQHFSGGFYKSSKAKDAFRAYVTFVVPKLKGNPAIIWELANEPRGMNNVGLYHDWIDETAGTIRSLGPGQLVTTGSEGQTASPRYAGLDVVADHKSANIDFVTFHMWAQNWGWVKPDHLADGYPKALALAKKYVNEHATLIAKLGKPLLLEEFGFPRDGGSFDPASPTTLRDKYFQEVYALVHELTATTPVAGIMPWAWAGDTRPPRPGQYWKPGDPFCGDPPHEEQGWYSVYSTDTTVQLIKDWSAKITGAAGVAPAA